MSRLPIDPDDDELLTLLEAELLDRLPPQTGAVLLIARPGGKMLITSNLTQGSRDLLMRKYLESRLSDAKVN